MQKNPNDAQVPRKKPKTSCWGAVIAFFFSVISIFWILNFSAGIFEIPDNIPIIGNLDEAFFTMLLVASLSYFGIDIPIFTRFLNKNKKDE